MRVICPQFLTQLKMIKIVIYRMCRSQWPRGLSCGSAAACLVGLWVRIPSGAWMSVSCECCLLLCRGLCAALISCPEESYWLWCVWMSDYEPSIMRSPWPNKGCRATFKNLGTTVRYQWFYLTCVYRTILLKYSENVYCAFNTLTSDLFNL